MAATPPSPPLFVSLILLLLSLLSLSAALSSQTVIDAAEILSDSGFVSMALTLELVSRSLVPPSPSLTIFAPPDSAFTRSGQPALSLLQTHFCPLHLPLQTLKSLPVGTKIPTLLSGHSLIVTTPSSGGPISLNDAKITSGSPIYDDGFLIIYGVDNFFDLDFHLPIPIRSPGSNPICGSSSVNGSIGFPGDSLLERPSRVLKSYGYNDMAWFLDLQLVGFSNPDPMTVFAPPDQAMLQPLQDASVFLRHVVPCSLPWSDVVAFSDGTTLPTYVEGFIITVSRGQNGVLLLNGVPVFIVNMFFSDKFVVHGLREAFEMPKMTPRAAAVAVADADEESVEAAAGSGNPSSNDEVASDNTEF